MKHTFLIYIACRATAAPKSPPASPYCGCSQTSSELLTRVHTHRAAFREERCSRKYVICRSVGWLR